jgi:hypothetical protein
MPELDSTIVELFTAGRLLTGAPETERALAAALAAARRYCGWHVTPVRTDVVTLDGSGDVLLALPTRKLVTLITVVEDGVPLSIADLAPSEEGRILTKKSGACWTRNYRAIEVTMTHGYDTAPDFDNAVLSALNRASFSSSVGGASQTAGPFQYTPQGPTEEEKCALAAYRIEPLA